MKKMWAFILSEVAEWLMTTIVASVIFALFVGTFLGLSFLTLKLYRLNPTMNDVSMMSCVLLIIFVIPFALLGIIENIKKKWLIFSQDYV